MIRRWLRQTQDVVDANLLKIGWGFGCGSPDHLLSRHLKKTYADKPSQPVEQLCFGGYSGIFLGHAGDRRDASS